MHKSIFGRGSAPYPTRGAHDAPQTPIRMVREHPSPSTHSASRFRRIRNGVVIGPRDNGFSGSAVALDGPDISCWDWCASTLPGYCRKRQTEVNTFIIFTSQLVGPTLVSLTRTTTRSCRDPETDWSPGGAGGRSQRVPSAGSSGGGCCFCCRCRRCSCGCCWCCCISKCVKEFN